jgi:hypothetical protein
MMGLLVCGNTESIDCFLLVTTLCDDMKKRKTRRGRSNIPNLAANSSSISLSIELTIAPEAKAEGST